VARALEETSGLRLNRSWKRGFWGLKLPKLGYFGSKMDVFQGALFTTKTIGLSLGFCGKLMIQGGLSVPRGMACTSKKACFRDFFYFFPLKCHFSPFLLPL
jgi:hypothetical protein